MAGASCMGDMLYLLLAIGDVLKKGRDIANCQVKLDTEIGPKHERPRHSYKELSKYGGGKTASSIKLHLAANSESDMRDLWAV